MSLSGENGMGTTMLVSPTSNGVGSYPVYSGGNGGFGNQDGWWIVLLIILLAAGGNWGNANNGGGFNGFGGGIPYVVNTGASVQSGFDQASIMGGLNGIQSAVSNGFSNVQQSLCSGFASAEVANNARQMANMQQMFALQSQFSDCCCENRLANCQTQNIIQNEGNATRFADANNTRDLLTNQTANTQAILDKLCQLELDAKNDKISDLERQLTMANLSASQTAQTSRLLSDNQAQTQALEQYLNPVPIPAYIVQNPSCCQQNVCGCGGF